MRFDLIRKFDEVLGFGSRAASRNRVLLITLVVAIGIMPLFSYARWLQDVMLAVVLLACIRSVSTSRRSAITAWSLGVIPILNLLLFNVLPQWLESLGRILVLPFFAYTVIILLKQLMSARRATAGELYGAASTYLLIGLTWGLVFVLLELVSPGSFSFPDHDHDTGASLFYFSFVTLVTLGYGEITPITEVARSFSVIEAIMGALFLTMLVARLVGLFTSAQMIGAASGGEESDGEAESS